MHEFSPDHYRYFLETSLQAGYASQTFEQYCREPRERVLLLRHDVDVSLELAVEMARVEQSVGVRSTYFIRVHAVGYNPFSRDSYRSLHWLEDSGFEVGLHHEVGGFVMGGVSAAEQLQREVASLEAALGRPVWGVAGHLPRHASRHLNQEDLRAAGIQYEAGEERFNRGITFVSDSNRCWKPACPCSLVEDAPSLYAAVHPVWWMGQVADPEVLRRALLAGE